jgi:hypothetical protein
MSYFRDLNPLKITPGDDLPHLSLLTGVHRLSLENGVSLSVETSAED